MTNSARQPWIAAPEVFVPLILSTGGNTGSQSSSLVIRGMALGEFGVGDAVKILWRELRMGLVLGSVLGLIGFFRALFVGHSGGGGLAVAVGLALVAKLVGEHGGIIECDSSPRGTSFRILMPAWKQAPDSPDAETGGQP